jgi:hypothetical protein
MENKTKTIIEWTIKGGYPAPKGEYYNKDGTLGGWWYKWKYEDYETGEERETEHPCCFDHPHYFNALIIDPKFFQAIGRAVGWEKYIWLSYPDYHYDSLARKSFTNDEDFSPDTRQGTDTQYAARYITWQHYAHCLYDKNLTEGMDSAIDYLYGLLPVNE